MAAWGRLDLACVRRAGCRHAAFVRDVCTGPGRGLMAIVRGHIPPLWPDAAERQRWWRSPSTIGDTDAERPERFLRWVE